MLVLSTFPTKPPDMAPSLSYQIWVDTTRLDMCVHTYIQNLSLIIYAIQLTGSALMWYSRVEREGDRERQPETERDSLHSSFANAHSAFRFKKVLLQEEGTEAIEYTWCRKQERYQVMKIINAISYPRHIQGTFIRLYFQFNFCTVSSSFKNFICKKKNYHV